MVGSDVRRLFGQPDFPRFEGRSELLIQGGEGDGAAHRLKLIKIAGKRDPGGELARPLIYTKLNRRRRRGGRSAMH